MPARYDNAAVTSSLDAPHADTQSCTFAMKSEDGQKQEVSELDSQLVRLSHVFRQLGRTEGQGADGPEGGGDAGVVAPVTGVSVAEEKVDGGGRWQRVQTVDVDVMVIVEIVCVVSVRVSVPVVCVRVTGQVVRVVKTISVVIRSVSVVVVVVDEVTTGVVVAKTEDAVPGVSPGVVMVHVYCVDGVPAGLVVVVVV